MRMKPLFSVAALGVLLALPSYGEPKLVVGIDPAQKDLPSDVSIEVEGQPPASIETGNKAGQYTVEVAVPHTAKAPIVRCLVVAEWPTGSRQLYLRITPVTPKVLMVKIYNQDIAATQPSLDRLSALGDDPGSLFRKYFGARDIYRELAAGTSQVKNRALRLWFDTAFKLSKMLSYIGRDEEVIRIATETRDPYYIAQAKNYIGIEWREFGEVAALVRSGKVDDATALVKYYSAQFKAMDEDNKATVAAQARVTPQVVEKSLAYVQSLRTSE